jgi:replication factor C large subunit
MTKPWIQKYLPKNTSEVFGQQKAIEQLKHYVINYKTQKNKCAILFGGIGSGKTSSVIALANELSLELVEMNSSDFRNKEKIHQFVGSAINQRSLFFSGKIILIDELDALSGTKDRGAIQELMKLIENSSFPLICTVNDPFDKKISGLRKKSQLIEFQSLDYRTITNNLMRILDAENCEYDEDAVKAMARRCGGDMRAAINDCQTGTASGNKKLDKQIVLDFESHERNRTETLMNALLKVMKTTDIDIAKSSFDNIDEDLDTIGLWLEENIPKEYKNDDLKQAMMWLSRCDVYKGRIRKWQYWRFMVYINILYSAGIALSKKQKYPIFIKYSQPSKILKLWQAKMKYQKRKLIAEKIANNTHTSSRRVIQDVIPYIQLMCRKKELALSIQKEFELEKEEIEWLKK